MAARHGISMKLVAVLGARNSAAKVQKGGDVPPPRPGYRGRPVGIGQPAAVSPSALGSFALGGNHPISECACRRSCFLILISSVCRVCGDNEVSSSG